MIKIYSCAKINLSLDVRDLMDDGYHQVDTIMQLVSLCDEISVDVSEAAGENVPEILIKCDDPQVPRDNSNLAYRAALLMYRYAGEATGNRSRVSIDIKKGIPVAAGLAGGSGNAAAVIQALNLLWDLNLPIEELCKIGGEIGADVAFCTSGESAARGTGRGEILSPCSPIDSYVVLVKPDFGISTKEVYQGIDTCEITARPDNDRLEKLLSEGSAEAYSEMVNVLEEYTLSAYPIVKEIKDNIQASFPEANKVLMSGSGPTVFALFDDEEKAKSCADTLAHQSDGGSKQVYLCRTL